MQRAEVLFLVFLRLDGRELASVCCCCKLWYEIGRSDHLWRSLCVERWPGCAKSDGRKAIEAMGGFRVFFMRRAWTMTRPPKKLQPRPWLRLDHLTFFVDLTYKGMPIISEALPGSIINQALCYHMGITPAMKTDAVLPRQALTPLFYEGQLYYEKPFQASYGKEYWLNWSVARSTDNRMACLLDTTAATEGEYGWDEDEQADDAEQDDDGNALPLVFEGELGAESGSGSEEGVLKKRWALWAVGCLDCRAVWGDSLSQPMHFKLLQLHLRFCHRTLSLSSSSPSSAASTLEAPPLHNLLLALQQLDWK